MTYALSKIFWWFANPAVLGLILLCLGTALLWTRWRRVGRTLLTGLALLAIAVSILPVGAWLLNPLEERFPAPPVTSGRVDGIVVLGGTIDMMVGQARHRVALSDAAERITALVALARRYPDARLIFAGGSGHLGRPDLKEALVVGGLVGQLGVAPERLLLESESRNTYENALFTKRLANPQPGERWLLVTSAWHMPRAVGAFRRVGWPVTAYPVDYRTRGTPGMRLGLRPLGALNRLDTGLKEWIGLVVYRALDRTDALFPAPD